MIARMLSSCSCVAIACIALPASLLGQRPDAAGKGGVSRSQLEATFLGGAPAVESIEVNGTVLRLADLQRDAGGELGPREAMERFVLAVVQAELERRGAWLDDKAYEDAYDEYRKPYDDTPFSVKVVATKFKGYPSLEAFQQRWRVFESLRRLPRDARDDTAKEAEQSRDLLVGNGVEIECWQFPAAKQADGRRDFAAAEAAATAALAKLRAGASFEAGESYSRHGEQTPLQQNPLMQVFREGEYTSLLREPAAAVVMRAKVGELVGPLRCPDAVFVVRVVERTESGKKVDLKFEAQRDLVRQLLEQRQFFAFVDEVLAKAVLRLPRR
jgi:hypothetical protein